MAVLAAISKARMDFRKTLLATSRKLRQEAEKNKKDVVQEIEEEEQRILEQVGISRRLCCVVVRYRGSDCDICAYAVCLSAQMRY